MPGISVILPVYNGSSYLGEAIDSILSQTYGDFELILIDDGSTDDSERIIRGYGDPRIRYIRNDRNRGIVYTLNRGIGLAQGRYIARMDADDISMPDRFMRQVRFLETHPEIGFCGTWAWRIGKDGKVLGRMRKPSDPETVRICTLFTIPFIHPSVMFRAEAVKGRPYDPVFRHAEDFELWARLQTEISGANVPAYLFRYRWHGENISIVQEKRQEELHREIVSRQLEALGITPGEEDCRIHRSTFGPGSGIDLDRLADWFRTLRSSNMEKHVYDSGKLDVFLLSRWVVACVKTRRFARLFSFLVPSFRQLYRLAVLLYEKK